MSMAQTCNDITIMGIADEDMTLGTTKKGKPVAKGTISVPKKDYNGNPTQVRFSVTAYSDAAHAFAKARRGQTVLCKGMMDDGKWMDRSTGVEKKNWQVLAWQVIVDGAQASQPAFTPKETPNAEIPDYDDIPF
jgi:hypothetical protein